MGREVKSAPRLSPGHPSAAAGLLYPEGWAGPEEVPEAPPDHLADLHLDRVLEAILASREEYSLAPFFWRNLSDPGVVRHRQAVARDLEREEVSQPIRTFSEEIRRVRRFLAYAEASDFDLSRKGWFLEAALAYGEAVLRLAEGLRMAPLRAPGLQGLRGYLEAYVASSGFRAFVDQARRVKAALAALRFEVVLEGGGFRVRRYQGEDDYTPEITALFAKFRQEGVALTEYRFPEVGGMNHLEAKMLEFVARLYPGEFAALERFFAEHAGFLDPVLLAFDREAQFYLAYLDFIADLRHKGLPFCYPEVTLEDKAVYVEEGFDLALAHARGGEGLVLNSFALKGAERIVVVTGANQGGKTTFARMFGQIHHLASLGLPVPGRAARLFLFDRIFTHFERRERVSDLQGRLEKDLLRIRDQLRQATPRSLFILNEIFASTAYQDALFLSRKILERLLTLDALGVWVTFLEELASMGEKVVSMVALVDPEDPQVRTYRIVRKPADGLAYALALARKHGLTYEAILRRIP